MEIRPVQLNDLPRLVELAEGDGHSVVRPTHVALNGEGLLGYASIGAVPLVVFYMHTVKSKAVQTFRMEKYCEDLLRRNGVSLVCAPCAPESPIYPFMPKLGFLSFGRMDMFMKSL